MTISFTRRSRFHDGVVRAVGGQACHAGLAAAVLPSRHILLPGAATCASCHRSARDMATAVMNHGVVSAPDCKTCHGGANVAQGIMGIPGRLLNGTGMDCDDCHKGFAGSNRAVVKINNNASRGEGAGLCKGCHLQDRTASGPMARSGLNLARMTGLQADGCSTWPAAHGRASAFTWA